MKKLAHEWNITIDEEFESVNRKLSAEEQNLLEADLDSDGCRDALVVWRHEGKRILLDGHYRYKSCASLGIPFGVVAQAIASREQVIEWIKTNQRARRNCTPAQLDYLIGKRHEEEKLSGGRPSKRSQSDTVNVNDEERCQSDTESSADGRTRDRLASEFGVSPRTVMRNAAFARAADTVAANAGTHETLAAILAGELGTKKDIQALADLQPDKQREAVARGKPGVKSAVSGAARKAPKRNPEPQSKLALAGVKEAFLGLSEEDRMAFLDWIDSEVFETTIVSHSW